MPVSSVRAKVKCRSLTDYGQGAISVELVPVTSDGNPENREFYAYTPGGEFKMTLSPKAAAAMGMFALGNEYYVDFTPVPTKTQP